MTDRKRGVLILCTGNSARSILGEALFNRLGEGRFIAYSAGSKPVGAVNPYALEVLREEGFDVSQLRSKSWDEFSGEGAPDIDFVFTVCDNAAGETCPLWPGAPITAHWGLPDPAAVEGSDEDKRRAFAETLSALEARIARFLELPLGELDPADLRQRLDEIGAS
jgi:arsenate reductase